MLTKAIIEAAKRGGDQGVAMGTIVDKLEAEGFDVRTIEQEVWRLLSIRRLTPSGFVARTVRRSAPTGEVYRARCYEFLLLPWSADLDQQLELGLDRG